MPKKLKFKPVISRIKLNPEQAVLTCCCYSDGFMPFGGTPGVEWSSTGAVKKLCMNSYALGTLWKHVYSNPIQLSTNLCPQIQQGDIDSYYRPCNGNSLIFADMNEYGQGHVYNYVVNQATS